MRQALEAAHGPIAAGYLANDLAPTLALRAPDFHVVKPSGEQWTKAQSDGYVRYALQVVRRTVAITFDSDTILVHGDTAAAQIHQHWVREQQMAGKLRQVDTRAVQWETWIRTPDGWRLWLVDWVRPEAWVVDGKRVDPSKPYDPGPPPFERGERPPHSVRFPCATGWILPLVAS